MKYGQIFGGHAVVTLVLGVGWLGCSGSDPLVIALGDAGGEASTGASSGAATSGTSTSGMATSGADTSGMAASGTGIAGSGTSGSGTSGTASSGTAASGSGTSGTASSGTSTSGAPSDAGTPIDAATPADSGAASASCAKYCTDVGASCALAGDQQYADRAECLAACASIEGSTMASGTNTIACRTTHAALAAAAPYPHCWHAGLYGYGVCGSQCDAFCILANDACPGTYTGCKGKCMAFAKVGAPTAADGGATGVYTASGPTTGNTIDCREYYLGRALAGIDKVTSCANAGDMSPVCK